MPNASWQLPAPMRGRRSGRTTVVCATLAMAVAACVTEAVVAPGRAASATPSCTQYISTSAVGTALGFPVRAERAGTVDVVANQLGVECAFYPVHPTEHYPSSEPAGTLIVENAPGSTAALHQLIAFDTNPKSNPGFKQTPLHGIGTQARLGVQKGNGLVIVWVLAGHTVYYVWSQEAHKKALEKFARAVAHAL